MHSTEHLMIFHFVFGQQLQKGPLVSRIFEISIFCKLSFMLISSAMQRNSKWNSISVTETVLVVKVGYWFPVWIGGEINERNYGRMNRWSFTRSLSIWRENFLNSMTQMLSNWLVHLIHRLMLKMKNFNYLNYRQNLTK